MAKSKYFSGAGRALSKMNHKDLQRACIARGLEFENAVEYDVPRLASWFVKYNDRTQDLNLLNLFDIWRDEQLKARGYKAGDPIFHSSLRLGFVGKTDEDGNVTQIKKPRGAGLAKKKKKKRERDTTTGLFSGTKKALTYQCAKDGKSMEETVKIVIAKFSEAQEKSIKIWYKRATK